MKAVLSRVIPAFDATEDQDVSFTWTGNKAYSNRILILNSSTNEAIYDDTIETNELSHTIPANTLTNNTIYTCQIQVFDQNNNASDLSDKIILYCYSTPTFQFSNITDGDIISSLSLSPELYYYQSEGIELEEFIISLYDSTETEIYNSGVLYNISDIKNITGLIDKETYSIVATGTTIKNTSIATEKLYFSTSCDILPVVTVLYAENESSTGRIKLVSNIQLVETSSDKTYAYIDESEINLIDDSLTYDEGIDLSDDFSLIFTGRNLTPYSRICEFSNGEETFYIKYMIDTRSSQYDSRAYFKLYVPSAYSNYVRFTGFFDVPDETTEITIFLSRISNLYNLNAVIGGETY